MGVMGDKALDQRAQLYELIRVERTTADRELDPISAGKPEPTLKPQLR